MTLLKKSGFMTTLKLSIVLLLYPGPILLQRHLTPIKVVETGHNTYYNNESTEVQIISSIPHAKNEHMSNA